MHQFQIVWLHMNTGFFHGFSRECLAGKFVFFNITAYQRILHVRVQGHQRMDAEREKRKSQI